LSIERGLHHTQFHASILTDNLRVVHTRDEHIGKANYL
jgi:hypothetical protein